MPSREVPPPRCCCGKIPGFASLIVEKSAQLSRRVGEATVEVSAYFMGRVLGLTQYLNECQLVKQGLRFWFRNDEVKNLEEASELGGRYQVRLPSYQLDRATFDEEVLRRACVAGAELLRPASVIDVQLSDGGEQTITLKNGEGYQRPFARAGLLMPQAWLRYWPEKMVGGNRTPRIPRLPPGRAGKV